MCHIIRLQELIDFRSRPPEAAMADQHADEIPLQRANTRQVEIDEHWSRGGHNDIQRISMNQPHTTRGTDRNDDGSRARTRIQDDVHVFLAGVGATRIASQALFTPADRIPQGNEIFADRKAMECFQGVGQPRPRELVGDGVKKRPECHCAVVRLERLVKDLFDGSEHRQARAAHVPREGHLGFEASRVGAWPAHAGDEPGLARKTFEVHLQRIVADVERKMPTTLGSRRNRALATIALCVGGMMLARSINDVTLSNQILAACRQLAVPEDCE